MRGMISAAVMAAAVFAAGTASAAPVDGKTAKGMLFKAKGLVFQAVTPQGLDATAEAQVAKLVKAYSARTTLMAFEASGYSYYGAMAVPVGKALGPESLAVAAGLHNPAAAQQAALEACEAAQQTGCTLVGFLLPKGYKTRDLSLSGAATAGFGEAFTKGDGPRYLAYSPTSSAFSIVRGPGADIVALETCNSATNGREDCVIGVADE